MRISSTLKRFYQVVGPGIITGASDDDPSGIGTYAIAGATLGFGILWTALATFPMMTAVQYISAKVGLVSGTGIIGVLRKHYSKWLLYPVTIGLVIANTINAGTDIGAVAVAIKLLIPIPAVVWILPVAIVIVGFQIFGSYRLITNIFRWLTLALLAYVGAAFFAKPDWGQVLRGTLLPAFSVDSKFLAALVALLGTTISPYLFFWQASEEVEEEYSRGRKRLWQRKGATEEELEFAAMDTAMGMFFSNAVMYFIILATADTLFTSGKTDIKSATDAAEALRPIAGNAASLLLAIGLIGSGLLAIPVLTGSAAYAVAEIRGWKAGLDQKPQRAKQFYAVIAGSTLVGMLINFIGINPIDALFGTAIINGLLAPPVLVILMFISNNEKVMGNRVNSLAVNLVGWITTLTMFAAAVGLILTLVRP